jgi:hypothetical protein
VAGCATPTGFAGHAGATANLKLTFHPDHSAGADQAKDDARQFATRVPAGPAHQRACAVSWRRGVPSRLQDGRGEPTQDSERMRRRLAALIGTVTDLEDLWQVVPREVGVDIPYRGGYPDWPKLLADCALQDVLDIITVVWAHLAAKFRKAKQHEPWARWYFSGGWAIRDARKQPRRKPVVKGGRGEMPRCSSQVAVVALSRDRVGREPASLPAHLKVEWSQLRLRGRAVRRRWAGHFRPQLSHDEQSCPHRQS